MDEILLLEMKTLLISFFSYLDDDALRVVRSIELLNVWMKASYISVKSLKVL